MKETEYPHYSVDQEIQNRTILDLIRYFQYSAIGIFILATFPLTLSAQPKKSTPPKWENQQVRENLYPTTKYFVSYLKKEEVKSKSYNPEKQDQFKHMLKQDVSSNIYSTVKYKSETRVNESTGYGISKSYDTYTKIESDINISGAYDIKTKYLKKDRILYGIIFVEKEKLGVNYLSYFKNEYELLSGQMSRYSLEGKSVYIINNDLSRFRQRKDVLSSYITIISICGVQVPSEYNKKVSGLEAILSEIEESMDMANIESSITNAENYFEQGKYAEALALYEVLKIKIPDDRRIVNGIMESKRKLELQYVSNANNYRHNSEYDKAVLEYDKLFIKIPEVKKKYEKEYNEIERIAFDKLAKQLDNALVNMTLTEVEVALEKLERYQYVDQNKYNKYYKKVENYTANKLYNEALIEFYDKRYTRSIVTVKRALAYQNDSKYIRLKKDALNELYKIDLNELKLTRPHVFAFQVGGGYQTQNSYWNSYNTTEEVNIEYQPSLTAGFYYTYGKHENIKASGKDKSRKNLLGFRYTYVFRQKKSQVTDINELEFVVGFARYFLFNVGVSSFYLDPNIQEIKLDALSTGLALRWYMHPLELQFEVKTYLDTNYNLFPVGKLSMVIHGKMKRKINHSDRKSVRLKVESRN